MAGAQGWRSAIVLLYLQFLVHLGICESTEMFIPRDVYVGFHVLKCVKSHYVLVQSSLKSITLGIWLCGSAAAYPQSASLQLWQLYQ